MTAYDLRPNGGYRPAQNADGGAVADMLDPASIWNFLKRRAAILTAFLAIALAGGAALFLVTERQYRATAELIFEVTGASVSSTEGYERSSRKNDEIDTEVEVLRSPSLVRAAILDNPQLRTALEIDDADVSDRVKALSEADVDADAKRGPLAAIRLDRRAGSIDQEPVVLAARRVTRNLTVSRKGETKIVELAYLDDSPEKAALVLDALLKTYLEQQRAAKFQASEASNELLGDRIERLREELSAAETRVEQYRVENGLISGGEASLEERRVVALQETLAKTRGERRLLELKVERLNKEGISQQLSSPALLDLQKRLNEAEREFSVVSKDYLSGHPKYETAAQQVAAMRDLVRTEQTRIAAGLRDELKVAQEVESALSTELDELSDVLRERETFQVGLRELERQASASRQAYEAFLSTAKVRTEGEKAISADARVLEPARAGAVPYAPQLSVYLLIAGVAGVLVGVAAGLIMDYNPHAVDSVQELEKTVPVRALGYVPEVRAMKNASHISDMIIQRPRSIYSDSVNRMAVMLDMAAPDNPRDGFSGQAKATPLLFTSAVSQEGKSSTALAFARSCAAVGERVILVDTDLRRPAVAEYLGAEVAVGIEDVLRGEAALSEAIIKDELSDLVVLPATGFYGRPTELLKSKAFEDLIKRLSADYTRVVIDAPPVLAFPEAVIVGAHCAGVVLAIKWRSTKTPLVRDAHQQLISGGVTIAGAVLTQAHLSSMQTAGFYDAKYYTNDDDFSSPRGRKRRAGGGGSKKSVNVKEPVGRARERSAAAS
ncbi:MAG: AAA family ATPase [Pseudomonadota bacterium]